METWARQIGCAITVCDRDGIILDMNDKAAATFATDGGRDLVSKNLFDCHGPESQSRIRDLISRQAINAYTIEKNGRKKLIYQAPWYDAGRFMGLVELSIEIPFEMPHFNRD
jgi:transcriptional regulator with PAS, ATPase and Fis domain